MFKDFKQLALNLAKSKGHHDNPKAVNYYERLFIKEDDAILMSGTSSRPLDSLNRQIRNILIQQLTPTSK